MFRTFAFLALAGSALAGGCAGATTVSELPTTVTVKLGEEFDITDPALTVRFAEVLQDSRCPVDVACIQAGSVTIRFSLFEPNGNQNTLVIESDHPAEYSHGVGLRLVSVDPSPHSGVIINPKDYRATLEVSRAPD